MKYLLFFSLLIFKKIVFYVSGALLLQVKKNVIFISFKYFKYFTSVKYLQIAKQ